MPLFYCLFTVLQLSVEKPADSPSVYGFPLLPLHPCTETAFWEPDCFWSHFPALPSWHCSISLLYYLLWPLHPSHACKLHSPLIGIHSLGPCPWCILPPHPSALQFCPVHVPGSIWTFGFSSADGLWPPPNTRSWRVCPISLPLHHLMLQSSGLWFCLSSRWPTYLSRVGTWLWSPSTFHRALHIIGIKFSKCHTFEISVEEITFFLQKSSAWLSFTLQHRKDVFNRRAFALI